MFLSINRDEKALFSLVLVQLKKRFPILCKYKEPKYVSKKELLGVLKMYAQNHINKKSNKTPKDFQSREQRISLT